MQPLLREAGPRTEKTVRPAKPPRAAGGVTREQIARAAGASAAAVSSFYNDRYYAKDRRHGIGLSPDTRQRILDASRALNYQPPDPAWRVRLYPETGDFCFLLPQGAAGGFANESFARMVMGVMRRLAGPPPRHLVCAQFDDGADYLAALDALPACIRAGTASRYLVAGAPNHSLLAALGRLGFPVVCLSRRVALPGVCSVVPDLAAAARLAVEHLLARGHRRLAFVAPPDLLQPGGWSGQEFTRGLREAMAAAGLPFDAGRDLLVLPPGEGGDGQAGSRTLAALLARDPRPTGVFCLDDWAAMEILRAALGAGVSVPGSLSLVGCNNHQAAASLHPALTTVDIPGEEMGAAGYDALETMRREGLPAEGHCIVLPVRLVERESTAGPERG